MTTFTPVNNLRATPLPQFTPLGTSTIPMVRLNPRWHTDVPLPQFAPNNNRYNAGGGTFPLIPIKPLPGGGGGGGGTVGYPI